MKTLSEKLELCKVCKNRAFDAYCGIVCKLTNAKPTFEDECADYDADEVLVKQEERIAEQSKDENEALDGKLPGSNWFIWIAGLSILNIGLYFIGWRFFFGLGTPQVFQELMLADSMPVPLAIVCMLMLPAFFLWTWWATAKKGIKLFYKLGWGVFLIDSILYLALCIATISNDVLDVTTAQYVVTLLVDIALHIFVLFSGFKLSQLKQAEGCNASLGHKVGYMSYIVLTVLVSVFALFYTVVNEVVKNPATTIEFALNAIEAELPKEIDEYTTLEKVEKLESEIRYKYIFKNIKPEDIDPSFLLSYPTTAKQEMLNNISNVSPFEILCWEQGFTNVYEFSVDSKVLFNIVIAPEEYKAAVKK